LCLLFGVADARGDLSPLACLSDAPTALRRADEPIDLARAALPQPQPTRPFDAGAVVPTLDDAARCSSFASGESFRLPGSRRILDQLCSYGSCWSATGIPLGLPPTPPQNAIQLPPAPDSAKLCLIGFATLGLLHLRRSTLRLGFHVPPQWYHDGGPSRVGRATPFDLDHVRLECCRTDVDTPAARLRLWRRAALVQRTGSLLPLRAAAAPRAPPLV